MTEFVEVDIGLNGDVMFLQGMHFWCFMMLLGADILNCYSINNKVSILFEIVSVLAYTLMILKNIECMVYLKYYSIGEKICQDFDLGHVQ